MSKFYITALNVENLIKIRKLILNYEQILYYTLNVENQWINSKLFREHLGSPEQWLGTTNVEKKLFSSQSTLFEIYAFKRL